MALEPDIALLQEVSGLPTSVSGYFDVRESQPIGKTGKPQRFKSVILARGDLGAPLALESPISWVESVLAHFAGNLLACTVHPSRGPSIHVINVYNPAWPLPREHLDGIDTSGVRLTLNRQVWIADLLWSALQARTLSRDEPWVIAGDFNLSETFDSWRGGPRGNREYLDRMASLGLVECLRSHQGTLTPTFRNPRGAHILHQIDHFFVTPVLASALVSCTAGEHDAVFGAGLSDHLPVVAEFAESRIQGHSAG